jgi:gamma-glutamyltranspeptidase/glutathione hydrolase
LSDAIPQTESDRGVVAAGHPAEVDAGLAMLEAGGNAIDALVAAAFVAYVVEPAMAGLGGYGRLSAFRADSGALVSVDHYLRAPAAARPDMFEIDPDKGLKYYETPYTKGLKAERGPLSACVPGAVAGLYWSQRRLGRLPWARVLEPAIAAARAGLEVSWSLFLHLAQTEEAIRTDAATAAILLPAGRLPRPSGQIDPAERLDLSDLAATLEIIAERGAAGFYEGRIAAAIGEAFRARGGILRAEDLAAYRPRVVIERPQSYRGLAYVTCLDPVGYEALNILDRFDLAALGPESLAFRHVMAEAMAAAFVDNIAYYGDPDHGFAAVSAALGSPALGARRAAMIDLRRALARPVAAVVPEMLGQCVLDPAVLGAHVALDPWPPRLSGTTQVAAADGEGNMAALITSVGSSFGSFVTAPGTGITFNNGMGNFDPRPGRPNSIAPGKMPIFAVPNLLALEDGKAVFAAAGSGGYRITTAILHALTYWRDFAMSLPASIAAPRVHCQGKETYVDGRIDAHVRQGLAALGHRVVVQQDDPGLNAFGRVSTVARRGGRLQAASGPPWLAGAGGL